MGALYDLVGFSTTTTGTGTLTTVFAVLIFVVAAYMLWKSAAAL